MVKSPIALEVEHIKKNFILPHEKNNSLKSTIVNVFKKHDTGYDIQHALKDINFQVHDGEFFGILGRNGSGKSTLLKILAEIYQPSSGTVSHKGKLVPFIELGVGFNPELTGRENVYLNGALLGFSQKEIEEKYQDIVDFSELEEFMDQKLKNYSSGMQVRLAFSVATRADADILLVDEVLAVGDADFQRKCYDYFKSLKHNHKTVVFVTHDMSAVKEYCDRAILIEDGLITHEGRADKVANEYLKLFNKNEIKTEEEQEADRWGNGEVKFASATYTIDEQSLIMNLVVQNRTDKTFDDSIDVGVDVYSDGKIVAGTHYLYYHQRGFSLGPRETKHITLRYANVFSARHYDVHLNIKSGGGLSVCDYWPEAISFTNAGNQSDMFFPIIIHPERFEAENE